MKIPESVLRNIWIILISMLLFMANVIPYPLFVLSASVILISPVLLELRRKKIIDERQVQISHFSSHITFYVFLLLLFFVINREYISKNINPPPQFYMLVIVPFVVKMLISLYKNYGPVPTAQWTGYFFSFFWLLFVVLSHGLSIASLIESIPFLIIFSVSLLSKKFPLAGGVLFFIITVFILVLFRGWWRFDIYVRLLMYSLIPLPLLASSFALVFYHFKEGKKDE
ncbi:hypothetical protein JW890_00580 [candidate division WOR-3 bacterium]|nr:hypothetical protein [candidate division WOR-3 bacterium]